MTAPGDTQALPRIPVPAAAVATSLPTVALTLAPVLAAAGAEVAGEPEVTVDPEVAVAPEVDVVPEVDVAPESGTRLEVVPAPEADPPTRAAAPADDAPADVPSHERIYEEAMATIAALASTWSSAVEQATGRHRAAA